ncbi:hypothetical protein [Chryseobacterium sp. JV274]|uniref:hypothetical protein n=1 Tax=Chryseobacterium sp. JV274 TaxID=1932669 RepID=UPI001115A5BE|nr:hypothetical protein [Chryseobacterium sp. JV274]
MENLTKHYTMTGGGSTLFSTDIEFILEQVRTEIENFDESDEPVEFEFGIKYLNQKEVEELGEFDGF